MRSSLIPSTAAVELATLDDLHLAGPHNVANALAAAALARAFGVEPEAVRDGLRRVHPGAHRNALVATIDDVAWVDDSKATNPHAAAASLAAYRSVVWVAGGLLKGADVDDLVRVARAITCGQPCSSAPIVTLSARLSRDTHPMSPFMRSRRRTLGP